MTFLIGVFVSLVINATLSGPSIETVEGTFRAVTGDLDGIDIEGGEGEYDLSHATGVECLSSAQAGDHISLGIANIDRSDVPEVPFEAELGSDRVVLWVICHPAQREPTGQSTP